MAAAACGEDNPTPGADLPEFSAAGMNIGSALCVSGPFSAKASSLERSLVLAGEYINGSTRAYPGVAPEDIPCRRDGTCGLWMGTDASGQELRGPMIIKNADTEGKITSAVSATTALVDDYSVPVVIGPCTADEMTSMFSEVTGTSTVLITPVVTADGITDLNDRTPADVTANLPGYVYRMIVPDYVQAQLLAQLATNSGADLIRSEDWTDDECTAEAAAGYCAAGHGAGYACLTYTKFSALEKDYFRITDDVCEGQSATYCDKYGLGSECYDAGGADRVCARYRERKFCAKQVLPQTAMVLYQNDAFGSQLKTEAQDFWVTAKARTMLSTQSFDPTQRDSFADALQQMFANAQTELAARKTAGTLPANYSLADSVVFLFTQAAEAALIFQELDIQRAALPTEAQSVIWLGTDALRSPLLTDQVQLESLRNVYALDPYSLDAQSEQFFEDLFEARWGKEPDSFAGTAFDSALMVALANERSGKLRRNASALNLTPNGAANIKDSLQPVSKGCLTPGIADRCSDDTSAITAYFPNQLSDAVRAIKRGEELKLYGVTGEAEISPAGDRINRVRLWKVAPGGPTPGFFNVSTISPKDAGLFLRK